MFVAIEGTDGSGKTTVRKFLYGLLGRGDGNVLTLQGQSWLAPVCTEIITYAKFHGVSYPPDVLTAATVGDKEALSDRVIRPQRAWRHIIADRWLLSDIVYNQVLWEIPMEITWRAFQASRVTLPDLTLFIDAPPELAWRRINSRPPSRRHRWDSLPMLTSLRASFERALDFLPADLVVRVSNTGPLGASLDAVAATVRHELPGVV